ncbi:hypothetical protein DL771_006318 [Monosporascus sp. 5C6A]|nr:hypothetical protein DL771_006318 [Monosporascus sp. 5C6A]
MPEKDSVSNSDAPNAHDNVQAHDGLRLLSRSPHPYRGHNSDRFAYNPEHDGDGSLSRTAFPNVWRQQTPSSGSGTEADDEHFLKGLPAPRQRLHKGLRGRNEALSGTSTPMLSPAIIEEEGRMVSRRNSSNAELRRTVDGPRRRKEIIRRLSELVVLGSLGGIVQANDDTKPLLRKWNRAETISLLYPLHVNLCLTLHTLTTTSLLPAELQLLSIALINVLLLSSSPQAVILKAGLWVGGLDLLVSCSQVILWGISLARVPKWRFKRVSSPSKPKSTFLCNVMSWRRVKHDLFHAPLDSSSCSSCEAKDDQDGSDDPAKHLTTKGARRVNTISLDGAESTEVQQRGSQAIYATEHLLFNSSDNYVASLPQRRHTLPSAGETPRKSLTHTPSGRRKRSSSSSIRAFFSLTQEEAAARKWQYAAYVYVCIVAALFAPVPFVGILEVVKRQALRGNDAVGWALGYMFGDLPTFRWQVVSHNLERWICLPARSTYREAQEPNMGWVEHLRHFYFGEANTRLLMCAYCITAIAAGLTVVFQLSPFYEVDTRRKVFHFMMVAMFLPLTYIDPAFVALALVIVLVLFLLLDLLRASQLPPLSKPLASFLTPYVDGRDLRGPVVVSHIFLLVGCAIPLWLSLGSLPRSGTGYLAGWEVPTREVSMVSGVVCVGLGDAAASLIGRRYGHRKWLWGGGKSLEGSLAFALAVFAGLFAAHAWLRAGGWADAGHDYSSWPATLARTGACAGLASLTEAVLTGGNDNVIVPVVLWTCVKSLGV